MIIPEDEAKQKWCPHARVGVRGSITDKLDRDWKGTSHNRAILLDNDGDQRIASDDVANCIGSACMAWCWKDPEIERVGSRSLSAEPEGEGWKRDHAYIEADSIYDVTHWERPRPNRRGYCGLAGEPK